MLNAETAASLTNETLNYYRRKLQAHLALANLAGDQVLAHAISKELCKLMELQFQLNPRARK